MSRIWDKKEETIAELESGSVPYRGKSTAEQYTDRDSKKHSKRKSQPKKHQENIQNIKRSIVKYWSRKGKYT